MTKKSKSKSKVTTSTNSIDSHDGSLVNNNGGDFSSKSTALTPVVKNGKLHSLPSSSGLPIPTVTGVGVTGGTPSLSSIPGIVDDFLAPKFVKVLNFSDKCYEKNPPPSLAEYKTTSSTLATTAATDKNANKVEKNTTGEKDKSSSAPSSKKNKKKKNKLTKNTNPNTSSYDSEDGRELDVLNSNGRKILSNENGDEDQCGDNYSSRHPSGLSSRNVSSLAQLQRIRNSAFHYEGNNIVLVDNADNGSAQYGSSYDDYNFNYDGGDEEDYAVDGKGPGSASVPSDETSTLGLDHDDDEDEEERVGSWSLSHHHHHPDYSYSSKQQPSGSIASSESSETAGASSLSSAAAASGNLIFPRRGVPELIPCTTIWDGMTNPCQIKDCSNLATKKCSQCKNAFYCCEEHQQLDWKNHKNECSPYEMESRFGDDVSVAVASRDIPPGQTIFTDTPLLVFALADPENDFLNVMNLPCIAKLTNKKQSRKAKERLQGTELFCNAVKPACLGCLKSVEFIGPPRYFCGSCKLPLCSYKCYLDPAHQSQECLIVSNQGGWSDELHKCYHSLYLDLEILRALQLESLNNSKWERFLQLKQNLRVEAYKSSESYCRFIQNYRELVPISAKMSGYHDDLIGNVHAIITALSFRPSLRSTYKLLFATQILFGHDCIPNSFHFLEESPTGRVSTSTLVTKAANPIVKGEIITIDFSPTPFMYYPLRRMVLQNVLSIDNCGCKRCRNPGSIGDRTCDIKCPRCRGGVIRPENAALWKNSVWACLKCLEEFSYQMVQKITTECRDEIAIILNQPKQYIVPALHQFITKREDQDLDPGHSILIQAWSFIEAHLRPNLAATRHFGPNPRYPEKTLADYRLLGRCCDVLEEHLNIVRPGICYEKGCLFLNRYWVDLSISAHRYGIRVISRKEYIQELMQCMRTLREALKIFQMFEGMNRNVTHHVQEATSALVTTKSFIEELLVSDNNETKTRRAQATNAALNSTAALLRDAI